MLSNDKIRRPAAAVAAPQTSPTHAAQAARIIGELDVIVGKSRRPSPLRRAMRGAGGTFAKWLDQLVAANSRVDATGLPPELKFPFF